MKTFPNESSEYRAARNELLEAEKGLREQVEKVAALRRQLPLGSPVKDYVFEELDAEENVRPVKLSELFEDDKESLFLYGYMYGPEMESPCPMCTCMLDSLDGTVPHLRQRINVAVAARSPIRRIVEQARRRGWRNLRLLSSSGNGFHRDFHAEDEEGRQLPMANVFVRRDGNIHHFWGSELMFDTYTTGNSRHVDLIWPLWNVLDLTPEGRGESWYPALEYAGGD